MRDLDAVLADVDAVLSLPDLPPLVSELSIDDWWQLRAGQGRLLDPEVWPPLLSSGRFGCDPAPVDERPRPRPPRPFPVSEADALRRRGEPVRASTSVGPWWSPRRWLPSWLSR